MMKQGKYTGLLLGMLLAAFGATAQTYTPVAVTGFNVDGFAESGTDASAVTSIPLDLSTNIMYTQTFGNTNNNLQGTGVPDNGTLTSGNRTYQLQPFNQKNILYMCDPSQPGIPVPADPSIVLSNTGVLSLATPQRFSYVSLLMFSTEGNSTVQVVLNFLDTVTGQTVNQNIGTKTIDDWFNATNVPITQGFGRTKRLTGPTYTKDGPPDNPKFFPIEVQITCAFKSRLLKSITFTYMSGTSTITSSRICCLGMSGQGYTPIDTASTVLTPATCNKANGSIGLTITGGVSPYSYLWNTSPPQTGATATGLAPGLDTVTVTGADGCSRKFPFVMISSPVATVTAAASPQDICATNSSTLTATVTGGTAVSYSWSPGPVTGNNVSVTPADTTTYTVTVVDNNGCTITAITKVNVIPGPNALFKVSPASVCLGTAQTVTYTGNAPAGATYSWNFAGATVQSGSGQGPYAILFNTAGIYDLQLQVNNNGCTSAANTQKDTVSDPLPASFSLSATEVCAGSIVTATYTGSTATNAIASWGWSGGAVQTGAGFGPYNVKYNSTGIVTLKVTNGACVSNAPSQVVTVIPQPDAQFSADMTKGCLPFTVKFTSSGTTADSYTWTFGDGTTATGASVSHSYTAVGTYNVSLAVSNQNKCFDSEAKTNYIEVKDPPVAVISGVSPAANEPIELHLATFSFTNGSQGATSYTWNFGDNSTASETNPQHKYRSTGNFTVVLEAKSDIGCTDTAQLQFVMVKPDKVLEIPNAFSPNGDGINDKWMIDGLTGNPDCQVQIFNRWGEQVYDSHGYENPWDGSWKGKPVPVATYYYVIKTTTQNYNGWVQLLR